MWCIFPIAFVSSVVISLEAVYSNWHSSGGIPVPNPPCAQVTKHTHQSMGLKYQQIPEMPTVSQ